MNETGPRTGQELAQVIARWADQYEGGPLLALQELLGTARVMAATLNEGPPHRCAQLSLAYREIEAAQDRVARAIQGLP